MRMRAGEETGSTSQNRCFTDLFTGLFTGLFTRLFTGLFTVNLRRPLPAKETPLASTSPPGMLPKLQCPWCPLVTAWVRSQHERIKRLRRITLRLGRIGKIETGLIAADDRMIPRILLSGSMP